MPLVILLGMATPASAQVVRLEDIPPEVAESGEGLALGAARSRLRMYLSGLQRIAKDFNARCRAVRRGSGRWHECKTEHDRLEEKRRAYNDDARQFNARLAALQRRIGDIDKTAAAFISRSAAAAAAAKENFIGAPLTPGSSTPGLLSGSPDYEKKVAEYEARKSDVFGRMIAQTLLRDECRKRLAACSKDGKAYDKREAIRRRDRQYFLWGEASYYIRFSDLLKDAPPEMAHEIGALGGIKTWPHGGEKFYIWLKRDIGINGSTPPGGDKAAQMGLQKALNDNQGFNP